MSSLTDEQLLELCRNGREQAFTHLVLRYKQELFHFLARFVGDATAAEDLFQETFFQVHLAIHRFDTSRRFKPWLFAISANKARDYLRTTGRRSTVSLSAPMDTAGDGRREFVDLLEGAVDPPDEQFGRRETEELVSEVLGCLAEHHREVLLLTYFHRFSYKEAAEVLKVPVGTVKSRLHTAVARFAREWKRHYGEGG